VEPHLKKLSELIRTEIVYHTKNPRRVLFDHLPKCAGTTINEYLLSHYPRRLVFRTNGRHPMESVIKFQSLPKNSRYGFHLIIGHLTNRLLDYIHPDIITLTVFREPIDRIISHYFFVRRDQNHYLHDQVSRMNIKLEDYASSGLRNELCNWYTCYFSGFSIEEAEMKPGESVNRAAQHIFNNYSIIGFQHDLPRVIEKLKSEANLYNFFQNPISNKTNGRITIEEVPDKTRKTIAEVNFLDVSLHALLKNKLGEKY
jgi:hypothetical protein